MSFGFPKSGSGFAFKGSTPLNKSDLSFGFPSNKILESIGTVIQNDWTVSANGWTKVQPSATIGLTGSNITFTGGSTGTTGNYVQWNGFISGSAKCEFDIEYLVTTIGAGLYLELKSTSGSTNNNSIRYYMNLTNYGSVMFNYNQTTVVPSSTSPTPGFFINNGDTVHMKLTLNEFTSTMTTWVVGRESIINTGSFTTTYAPPYPFYVYMNNFYKVRVGTFGGTFTMNKWSFKINDKKNITNLYLVDSLGRGLGCTYVNTAYPYLINTSNGKSFEVNGGPSGTMTMLLPYVEEIKAYRAKNVFNALGVNDYAQGRTIAQIRTDCNTIKTAVESVGGNFYQLSVIPNGVIDTRALNLDLKNTFKEKFIDIGLGLGGASYFMNPSFGVPVDPLPHMNDSGHNMIKNILLPYAI